MSKKIVSGPQGTPPRVMPIFGILGPDSENFDNIISLFVEHFGETVHQGPIVDFDQTDYYEREFGKALKRYYIAFEDLIDATELAWIKRWTWDLELKLANDGLRSINIDPGYLDLTRIVLASFKEGPQKLYLGDEVWADLVLWYSHANYQRLPWTFPDLKDTRHDKFFIKMRTRYKELKRKQTSF